MHCIEYDKLRQKLYFYILENDANLVNLKNYDKTFKNFFLRLDNYNTYQEVI